MTGTTTKKKSAGRCLVCGETTPAGHKVCDRCWPDKAIKAGKAAKCDLCGKPRMLDKMLPVKNGVMICREHRDG
jgi:hypothetical protein